MQIESSIGATSDLSGAGAAPAVVETPTTQDTSPASEQPAGSATAGDVQGTEADPLAGVPSLDELNQLPDDVQHKKSLIQLRTAIEQTFKPQLSELTEKFKPFESVADRFQTPEEVQELATFKEKLFGYERDDRNQLIPATQGAAQYLTEKYPQHADFLAADLLDMPTTDPETGRTLPRIDLALEAMKEDPVRRANALKILGGVEPTSIAPTWQPTAEEINAIARDPANPTPQEKALQDIYRILPYDEREELKLASPDFIRRQLEKEQASQRLVEQNRIAEEREARTQQAREQYVKQQAEQAGNKYVEDGFRQGMSEFANSIVERAKFIQPIDPQSEAARQMAPEQLAQMNQKIEKVNTGVGKMIATVTAALAVPDTAWVAMDFLKEIGVDPKIVQDFDNARLEYARNARDYGELSYAAGQQNGNGNHAGLGQIQSNVTKAMRDMKARGNLVSGSLLSLMSDFFEMKANSHNSTLNGVPSVRPSITGSAFDPTRETTQRQPVDPSRIYNREDVERMAY